MGQRLGHSQRLLTPLDGLRRIAQTPQGGRRYGQTSHSRQHIGTEPQIALRHWVGASYALLEVRPSCRVVAQVEQGGPERVMRFQAEEWCG
jgi:hypothetical protein